MSTVLFLIGYVLALPALFRWGTVLEKRNSLALAGHQLGIGIAMLGWFLRGRVLIGFAHLAWMIAAKVWFEMAGKSASRRDG